MSHLNHVAIIMDGNGRWANQRGKPRVWGHIRGSHIVADIVEKADELKISYLTLYALSYENLSRPQSELKVLYKLLEKFLKKERPRIIKNNIRFRVVGDYSFVSKNLQKLIVEMEEDTKEALGLNLSFAFGHSGRKSIENCIYYLQKHNIEANEQSIKDYFESELPDVDLMIRTGGDSRVSNFLLWQIAYSELCFLSEQWPDFSTEIFENIINKYKKIEKRYGGLGQWSDLSEAQKAAEVALKGRSNGSI